MNVLLALPVVLPVLAAGVSLTLTRRPTAQRAIGVAVLLVVLADAIALLVSADRGGPLVTQAGGWPAPFGITLVADRLSALLLVVSTTVTTAVLVFAVGQGVAARSPSRSIPIFHPAYLTLVAGIDLAFLTGDLFNLFVAFELMLVSSYVLITLNGTARRLRAGMTYTISSLTSSLLFLTAIALVYAATGTVNLADLGRKVEGLPADLRAALALLLLVVFGIKAAMAPLHFWLPDSYPTAPAPITAVLAGLLTKVGVYAMLRTQTLLFPREDAWPVLLVAAMLTMLVGILGALAQDDINRMLSFILVSHIGFMVFGLALFDVRGLTGAILYVVHHITAQATVFLVSGLVVRRAGTPAMRKMGGLLRSTPVLAALFSVPALSLSGIPPLSGFVAKFALLRAAVATGAALPLAVAAVAVLTSLLTLLTLGRAWVRVFWSEPGEPRRSTVDSTPRPGTRVMLGAASALAGFGVLVAVLAGPLAALSGRAAADLVDRRPYLTAVLGAADGNP